MVMTEYNWQHLFHQILPVIELYYKISHTNLDKLFTFSSAFLFSVVIFAFCACVNIPFCPVNIAILTPASISNTIIVITNAINVIPCTFFLI